MEFVECQRRWPQVETDDACAEVGELCCHAGADPGRDTGDDDALAVVTPVVSDACHLARGFLDRHGLLLLLGGLHPALVDLGHRLGDLPAVNLPPWPVGSPPNA